MARFRGVFALLLVMLIMACGRTPVSTGPELLVQVVDEAGDAIAAVDVELATTGDDPRVLARARTDGYGLASFAYPGDGAYSLHASRGPPCCWQEGTLEVTLRDPTRIVVVETTTGPCPTWVPTGC